MKICANSGRRAKTEEEKGGKFTFLPKTEGGGGQEKKSLVGREPRERRKTKINPILKEHHIFAREQGEQKFHEHTKPAPPHKPRQPLPVVKTTESVVTQL